MKECPFNEQIFVKKIPLGQPTERDFLDKIVDTVISDMNTPQPLTRIQGTKQWDYGCMFLSLFMLTISFLIAINFGFGIGKQSSV